jgi:hypothetical protein
MGWLNKVVIPAPPELVEGRRAQERESRDGGTASEPAASPRKRGQNEKTAPKGRSVSVPDLYQFDPD